MSKISKELMAEAETAKEVSMDELEEMNKKEVSKMGKVSEKLMAEDKLHEAISMEEPEAESSDVKIGGIKYQDIIDILHQLKLSDEEIKNLPAETVDRLNAYGVVFETFKPVFQRV